MLHHGAAKAIAPENMEGSVLQTCIPRKKDCAQCYCQKNKLICPVNVWCPPEQRELVELAEMYI